MLNLFFMWGYTNAAWTLGADETAIIARRLLEYMETEGVHVAGPRTPNGCQTETQTIWKLSSTHTYWLLRTVFQIMGARGLGNQGGMFSPTWCMQIGPGGYPRVILLKVHTYSYSVGRLHSNLGRYSNQMLGLK